MTAPTEKPPLMFAELDRSLLVWGVAILFDIGIYQVIAYRDAIEAARAAGATNVYAVADDEVATVVYHHPDLGWTCQETGNTFRTL